MQWVENTIYKFFQLKHACRVHNVEHNLLTVRELWDFAGMQVTIIFKMMSKLEQLGFLVTNFIFFTQLFQNWELMFGFDFDTSILDTLFGLVFFKKAQVVHGLCEVIYVHISQLNLNWNHQLELSLAIYSMEIYVNFQISSFREVV